MDIESAYDTAIKFCLGTGTNEKAEVQIADIFDTTLAMCEGIGTTVANFPIGGSTIPSVWVPPPSTLLALKVSHISLSVHWRKTAEDLVAMAKWFGKPVQAILEKNREVDPLAGDKGVRLLKCFVKDRLRESVGAMYTVPGVPAPQTASRNEKPSYSIGDAREILKAIRGEESVIISLLDQEQIERAEELELLKASGDYDPKQPAEVEDPTMLLSTRFLPFALHTYILEERSPVDQLRALVEMIIVVAVSYYLNTTRCAALIEDPNASAESIAEKIYHAALESVCTNVLVELPDFPTTAVESRAEFMHWYQCVGVYQKKVRGVNKLFIDGLSAPVVRTVSEKHPRNLGHLRANKERFNVPTLEKVHSLGILSMESSPLLEQIVYNFPSIWEVPPVLEKFVSSRRLQKASALALPIDVWQHVVQHGVGDHHGVLALSSTCKALNQLLLRSVVAEGVWSKLINNCWNSETIQTAQSTAASAIGNLLSNNDSCKSLRAFNNIYMHQWRRFNPKPVYCEHCEEMHEPVPEEIWLQENGGEHTEYHCVCPDCYDKTGSWGSCSQHDVFIIP